MLLGVSLKGLGRWEGLLVAEGPLGGAQGQTLMRPAVEAARG